MLHDAHRPKPDHGPRAGLAAKAGHLSFRPLGPPVLKAAVRAGRKPARPAAERPPPSDRALLGQDTD